MKSASFSHSRKRPFFFFHFASFFFRYTSSFLDFSHLSEFYLLRNDAQYAYHLQPFATHYIQFIIYIFFPARLKKILSVFSTFFFLSFFPFRMQKEWENFVFDGNINNNICDEKKVNNFFSGNVDKK